MNSTAPAAPHPAGRRGWRRFLAVWSVFALGMVALLWYAGRVGVQEQVFVIQDGASREGFWEAARRNLLLAHLSLSRGYPWVLLAPFVLWAASRFSLERDSVRRHLLVQALFGAAFVAACHLVNDRLVAGKPVRLIVAVAETSTRDPNGNGAAGETVTRLRREMRVSTIESPGVEPPRAAMHRDGATNRDGETGLVMFGVRGDASAWPDDLPEPPHSGLRFGWFRRGWGSAAALDLFVFISLCGLGHAAHFRRRVQERERRAAALEASLARARLHALQARLQPHFLFNTLNSITAMVRRNPAGAEEMLTSLGDLLRLALDGANRPWSTVDEELRFLQAYVDIQQTRFGDRLRFVQEIDPAALSCAIPSRLLQPLVENAVRHGIEPADRHGIVRVGARVLGESLELSVEDNGVGSPQLLDGAARPGVGLTNVQEQLQAMFGRKASLTFAAGSDGGLAVRMQMPARSTPPEVDVSVA